MDRTEDRSEIVFFDVETIYSTSVIVEFGAILVCPKTLTELRQPFSTLVRPVNPSLIPAVFNRSNGITRDALAGAPTFTDIADAVYELLHERVWAGHNILRFDCVHIREAFSEINRPPPEPRATIDSLPLLTHTFGRRAGDMKMASLATYFGLGQQRHRSLDDVRMNLEVIKYCATIMFLESSFPDILKMNSWVSANTTARNGSNGISLPDRGLSDMKMKSILLPPVPDQCMEGKRPIYQIAMCGSKVSESNAESCLPDVFIVDGWVSPSVATTSRSMGKSLRDAGLPDMISPVADQCNEENPPTSPNIAVCNSEDSDELEIVDANLVQQQIFGFPLGEEIIKRELTKPPMSSPATLFEASSSATFVVLKPHEIPISSLTASLVQSYHGTLRIQLLHNNFPFQLSCADLKIRFGKNCVYNNAGRPKLSFGVYLSETLCEVLEACDAVALSLFLESGSSSGWRPLVTRKEGFFNYPTVRIPISECGNVAAFATTIYKKESPGTVQRLRFNKLNTTELGSLLKPGTLVDAIFSLDQYKYQQSVGIRLVAQKLIIHK